MAYNNTAKMECTESGHITYYMHKNKKKFTARMELMKFCKHCKKHTLHKEIK